MAKFIADNIKEGTVWCFFNKWDLEEGEVPETLSIDYINKVKDGYVHYSECNGFATHYNQFCSIGDYLYFNESYLVREGTAEEFHTARMLEDLSDVKYEE